MRFKTCLDSHRVCYSKSLAGLKSAFTFVLNDITKQLLERIDLQRHDKYPLKPIQVRLYCTATKKHKQQV